MLEFLSTQEWLAVLRIMVGLWWLKSVWHKDYPDFVQGGKESGMMSWTNKLLDNHPSDAVANAIRPIMNASPTIFPYLIVLGELAVGIGLTFGLLTPIAALVAIFLNLNYLIVAGVRPENYSANPGYLGEQGQNYNMIAAEIIIFATGAWAVWSLDAALGWFPV